jgi:polyisoprenoid-binding protein YceI
MTTATETLPLAAGTWEPDIAHSSVEFVVRHLGLSKVRGRFGSFSASLNVGPDLATTGITATVDLTSVDTGNADRDGHLQSADFFNVQDSPSMTFDSTRIEPDGSDFLLSGDLTLNRVTRDVSFDVEFTGSVTDDDGVTHVGFSATTELSRKAFNITFDAPLGADAVLVADKVKVELEMQLIAVKAHTDV